MVNSLLDRKIVYWSKLKAFTETEILYILG